MPIKLTAEGASTASLAFLLFQEEVLTNEAVIELTKAGLSDDLIISKIRKSKTSFKLATADIVRLKKEGVSERVIAIMLDPQGDSGPPVRSEDSKNSVSSKFSEQTKPSDGTGNSGPAVAVGPVVLPTSSTPSSVVPNEGPWPAEVAGMPREVGLYYKLDGKFIQLYGKPIVGTKTGGFLKAGLTMGISKIRMKGQLPGKRAQLQVSDRTPTFYFYMPEGQTPEGFSIIRVNVESDRREFEVGSAGGLNPGMRTGLDLDKVSQISIERMAPHLYRVTPAHELKDGEYGFIGTFTYTTIGVAGAGEKIYDFGLPKKR